MISHWLFLGVIIVGLLVIAYLTSRAESAHRRHVRRTVAKSLPQVTRYK